MHSRSHPSCTDQRAVSPVIGVVMMVAITVILTGIIAAFVLGFGADAVAPPQASLAMEQNATDGLIIHHIAGQSLELETLYLRGDVTVSGSLAEHANAESEWLSAGESIEIELTGGAVPDVDDRLVLVWDVGSDAATLAELRWLDL